jgi:nicotinate phosphoribosyltransferase
MEMAANHPQKRQQRLMIPAHELPRPTNETMVTPMLTDLYQLTMAYGYYCNDRHLEPAVFELYFRSSPFVPNSFTVFTGLDQVLCFLAHFRFTAADINFLRVHVPAFQSLPTSGTNKLTEFFQWLTTIDTNEVTVHSIPDGTVVFPNEPLLIVQGPLAIVQMLETTLLTLVNYPSLLATNAARMLRVATAPIKTVGAEHLPPQCLRIPKCVEFGLRRAQGVDGGYSASKYAILTGGFQGTSNVRASQLSYQWMSDYSSKRLNDRPSATAPADISTVMALPLSGTHAHSFVQSYTTLDQVKDLCVRDSSAADGATDDRNATLVPAVLARVQEFEDKLPDMPTATNQGELAAFIAYAHAFPHAFLCLIDTYDTLSSGLVNFTIVASVLADLGYRPVGIRLDSGDLAVLSYQCAKFWHTVVQPAFPQYSRMLASLEIVASNDINEKTLVGINNSRPDPDDPCSKHAITAYGIGTNLVTCQAQPSLGCVYKLVESNGIPKIKISQDVGKVSIPGQKRAYRVWTNSDEEQSYPAFDVLVLQHESDPSPVVGRRYSCRHPTNEQDRAVVIPSRVVPLHYLVWSAGHAVVESAVTIPVVEGGNDMDPRPRNNLRHPDFVRQHEIPVQEQLDCFHPGNVTQAGSPVQYPVFLSEQLYVYFHDIWRKEAQT